MRHRSLVGTMILLGGLAAEAGLVMSAAEWSGSLPWPVQALYYAVAGIAWVVPAAYLTRWMVSPGPAIGGMPVSAASSGLAGSSARRSGRSP
jgi:hypothetical protein